MFNNKPTGQLLYPLLVSFVIILVLVVAFCWWWQKHLIIATCKTENLKLAPGQQSGAAGTIYQHMALTNTGSDKCTISGYPTAFLYGSDGNALGNGASARPQPAPSIITLAPNETAHTILGYPQAGNFNPGVCSVKSVSLKLYPPSATSPLETPLEVAWCPGFSESVIEPGN
jgi:hypothetical protein